MPYETSPGLGSTILELHSWNSGESLDDVIKTNMKDVFSDGGLCEQCQQQTLIGQQRRFSDLGDMLLLHIDRAAENEVRRTGAVRLPQKLPLESEIGMKEFQLVVVGCHYGISCRSGHWIT